MATDAVRSAVYSLALDTSGYQAAAQGVASSNATIVETTTRVTAANQTAIDGFARLEARYDPLIRAEQRRQAALAQANAYLEQGIIEQDRYGAQIARVNAYYDAQIAGTTRVSAAVANQNRAIQASGGGYNQLRGQVQNVAFQFTDFAVQVAAGTNAMRAATQQLPQLLGGFGPWGAVIGLAVAVVGALATALFNLGDNAKKATAEMGPYEKAVQTATTEQNKFKAAIDAANQGLKTQAELQESKANAARVDQINAVSDQLRAEQQRLTTLQNQEETARRIITAPGAPDPRLGGAANLNNIIQQAAAAQRNVNDLQKALNQLVSGPTGAQREAAQKAAEQGDAETEKQIEQTAELIRQKGELANATAESTRAAAIQRQTDADLNSLGVERNAQNQALIDKLTTLNAKIYDNAKANQAAEAATKKSVEAEKQFNNWLTQTIENLGKRVKAEQDKRQYIVQGYKDEIAGTQELISAMAEGNEAYAKEAQFLQITNQYRQAKLKMSPQEIAQAHQLADALVEQERVLSSLQAATQDFTSSLSDMANELSKALDGTVNWKNVVLDALNVISDAIIKMAKLDTGGGGGISGLVTGLITSIIPGLLGGGFSASADLGGGFTKGPFGLAAAGGADFIVGGTGGTDSQFVPMHLTPGERVQVTPPGMSRGGMTVIQVDMSHSMVSVDAFQNLQALVARQGGAIGAMNKSIEKRSVSAVIEAKRRGGDASSIIGA